MQTRNSFALAFSFKGVLIFSQSFPFHSNVKVFAMCDWQINPKYYIIFCFRDVIARKRDFKFL